MKDEKKAVLYHAALRTWKGQGKSIHQLAGCWKSRSWNPWNVRPGWLIWFVWFVSCIWLNQT